MKKKTGQKGAGGSTCTRSKEYENVKLLYKRPKNGYEPPQFNEKFLQAVYPHVSSFNAFLDFYIPELVKDLDSMYVDPGFDKQKHELDPFYCPLEYLQIYVKKVSVGKPVRVDALAASDKRLMPRTCRNGHLTYSAPLYVEFVHHNASQKNPISITKNCGNMPIMVRSNACHLSSLPAEEMVAVGEECNEPGGYFIINGNERVIRYVVQQRCNHPIAQKKPRFKDRDLFFTEYAVLMRCSKRDGTSTANILFFTEDNQCAFRIMLNRREIIVPFWTLLRALMPTISMELIKQKLLETEMDGENSVMKIVEADLMWREVVESETLFCDIDKYENRHLHQLGKLFWDLVAWKLKPGSRYEDAARHVIKKNILVHCEEWTDKFECLILMYRKLIALARGEISAENVDSFAYQEVITPGQLFASVLKDSLYNVLHKIQLAYAQELRIAANVKTSPVEVIKSRDQFELILRRVATDVSQSIGFFMATGNIKTNELDLQQLSGWTVVADRLNINRFLSHFRAVHRGQFFAKMRTTEVRKLVGETWGFLCPVHTPDGGPCGLLLHLAQDAVPVTEPPDGKALAAMKTYLTRRGISVDLTGHFIGPPTQRTETFPLVFDGHPLCRLPRSEFDYWEDEFRRLKLLSLLRSMLVLSKMKQQSGVAGCRKKFLMSSIFTGAFSSDEKDEEAENSSSNGSESSPDQDAVAEGETEDLDEFYDAEEQAVCSEALLLNSTASSDIDPKSREEQNCPSREAKLDLWSTLKDFIGRDLSTVSMPVYFNEPTSFLQRLAEDFQYASHCSSAVDRMMWVVVFTITPYSSTVGRTYKPFNPLLGETFELSHRGFRFIAEQVGHHPPVTAYHTSSEEFEAYGHLTVKNRFTGKSLEVTLPGVSNILMYLRPGATNKPSFIEGKTSDNIHTELITFQRARGIVNNVIFGKLTLEMFGHFTVTSHTCGTCAYVEYVRQGWWSREMHVVRAVVYDPNGAPRLRIGGWWSKELWAEVIEPYNNPGVANIAPSGEVSSCSSTNGSDTRCEREEKSLSIGKARCDADNTPPTTWYSSRDISEFKVNWDAIVAIPGTRRVLWRPECRSSNASRYYEFGQLAMELNDLSADYDIAKGASMPPTDSRFRPDQRLLEAGDPEKANQEKNRLEEKQRAAARLRVKGEADYSPRGFNDGDEAYWKFNGEYWKAKEKNQFVNCPNIF